MSRILVVDDSPTDMMRAVEILSSAGYVALEARCAADGIRIARTEHPDVILMDMHLPDMDGIEAIGILKSDDQTSPIPIIAVTAAAGDRENAIASGCDEYIEKPVGYKNLITVIGAFTGKTRF